MSERQTNPLDVWQQNIERAINVVPYVSLAVSTALSLVLYLPGSSPGATLALAAVATVWMLWFITLHPQWRSRRLLMGCYFVVLWLLMAALIAQSPLFGFFVFTGYLHAFDALHGRWRMAGVAATALLSSVSQVGGYGVLRTPGILIAFVVVAAFNIAISGALTFLSWVTDEQGVRSKQTIEELALTNEKLGAALAENAGLQAQLLAQAREAGVLDERQRLAGEIHDTLAQGLTGIVTQLEAADHAGERSHEWRRHVHTASRLARESLTEARRSVNGLRPQQLDDAQLPQALSDVLERWSAVSGVASELVTSGQAQRLIPEIEVTLLRTAQEALTNVAKHAGASRVALTLCYMEDLVTLDVRDDGHGFDPAQTPGRSTHGGFGLTGMRERVRRIDGTLEVESEPGSGTAISACVPALLAGAAR